jgi:hypothetical protein
VGGEGGRRWWEEMVGGDGGRRWWEEMVGGDGVPEGGVQSPGNPVGCLTVLVRATVASYLTTLDIYINFRGGKME